MVPRDKVDGYHFLIQFSAQQAKWYPFFFFLEKDRETEIENHRQERDKHMEGKAKERMWQRVMRHKLHLTITSGVT